MEFAESIIRLLKLLPLRVYVGLSFIPIALFVMLALWRADQGDRSTFKLIHFVTSDSGRGSYYALGYTGIVIAYIWGFPALILLDKFTVDYLAVGAGIFVIGVLGGTAARVVAKIKGAETDATAGDIEPEPPPAKPKPKGGR